MGNSLYELGDNPFTDFFVQMLLLDYDISEYELIENSKIYFREYVTQMGVSENDAILFNYDIEKNNEGHFIVKPNDIVSAMWFCDVFPDNYNLLFEKKEVIFDGKIYKFNENTKELTWEEIK